MRGDVSAFQRQRPTGMIAIGTASGHSAQNRILLQNIVVSTPFETITLATLSLPIREKIAQAKRTVNIHC
jgi:hypothetical protein